MIVIEFSINSREEVNKETPPLPRVTYANKISTNNELKDGLLKSRLMAEAQLLTWLPCLGGGLTKVKGKELLCAWNNELSRGCGNKLNPNNESLVWSFALFKRQGFSGCQEGTKTMMIYWGWISCIFVYPITINNVRLVIILTEGYLQLDQWLLLWGQDKF